MKTHYSIILKNIHAVQAGKVLLNNISLSVMAGQHLAIFGASGSGKSLLAKALHGELFHSGSVGFHKNDGQEKPRVIFVPASFTIKNKAHMATGYYQQRFNTCDAEDTITLMEALLEKGPSHSIQHWLETFQLKHRSNAPLIQLSNGELKKMQLILHLLDQPDILILDRVFTGLDMHSRKSLHVIINQLAASGTTIIFIADSYELPACITHFCEMDAGAILHQGPIDQLGFLKAPQQPVPELPPMERVFHVAPLISMQDVTISYGANTILNKINWKVRNGECWLIKGQNGAGKSTLLSLITGDNPQAYSQQIHLFGKKRGSGESIWDIKRKIGFLSPELQNFFDKSTTVFQAVASGIFDTIGLFKKLTATQEATVHQWLAYFGLMPQAEKPLQILCGGAQRLVLLARALVKNPLFLALDEPCQGLDNSQSKMIVDLIDRLHATTGMTILFISHYENEIPQCIQQVLELNKGVATLYKRKMPTQKTYLQTHTHHAIKAAIA